MPIPPGGYSKQEFLSVHGYSEKTFRALKKRNLAPRETLIPNSLYTRITEADYQAWLKLISQPDCQLEEVLRRQTRYEQSGRAALKAPGHPANMWARMKRREAAAQKKKLQAAE